VCIYLERNVVVVVVDLCVCVCVLSPLIDLFGRGSRGPCTTIIGPILVLLPRSLYIYMIVAFFYVNVARPLDQPKSPKISEGLGLGSVRSFLFREFA
jgi:hypothetical protein